MWVPPVCHCNRGGWPEAAARGSPGSGRRVGNHFLRRSTDPSPAQGHAGCYRWPPVQAGFELRRRITAPHFLHVHARAGHLPIWLGRSTLRADQRTPDGRGHRQFWPGLRRPAAIGQHSRRLLHQVDPHQEPRGGLLSWPNIGPATTLIYVCVYARLRRNKNID